MIIILAGFNERDQVMMARAKNYVARNFPGEGHFVSNNKAGADVVVTPMVIDSEYPIDAKPLVDGDESSDEEDE
tara:strand:- start:684 stop:905 length:222 start_codon:yes stop_codon:yes gene_type:complete